MRKSSFFTHIAGFTLSLTLGLGSLAALPLIVSVSANAQNVNSGGIVANQNANLNNINNSNVNTNLNTNINNNINNTVNQNTNNNVNNNVNNTVNNTKILQRKFTSQTTNNIVNNTTNISQRTLNQNVNIRQRVNKRIRSSGGQVKKRVKRAARVDSRRLFVREDQIARRNDQVQRRNELRLLQSTTRRTRPNGRFLSGVERDAQIGDSLIGTGSLTSECPSNYNCGYRLYGDGSGPRIITPGYGSGKDLPKFDGVNGPSIITLD